MGTQPAALAEAANLALATLFLGMCWAVPS
jgi:hypothetical protein